MYSQLLPASGLVCTAQVNPRGPGFIHRFFENHEEALRYLLQMDAAGHTMYLAQATFRTNENRKQVNVEAVKSFWLDIDCGDEKPYPTQKDGLAALKFFLQESGLPMPSVVNSGNGLYAHWVLETSLMEAQWKGLAQLLKSVTEAYLFKADPSRTSDSASVLRPVGTHNKKNNLLKPVSLIHDAGTIGNQAFITALEAAAKNKKVSTAALQPPKLNEDFLSGLEPSGPPAEAELIAEGCAQVANFKRVLGDVSEPLWYAMIGLLRHCENGEEILQEWSSGHPDYDYDTTARKIAQHTLPPTTCAKIAGENPSGCIGCKYKDQFKSPIKLGYPKPKQDEAQSDYAPYMPPGFFFDKAGCLLVDMDEVPTRIYPYRICPVSISHDAVLGEEVVTFEHHTPHEGIQKAVVPTAHLVADQKTFIQTLAKQGVQVSGKREQGAFMTFADRYTAQLRAAEQRTLLSTQMGWRDGLDGGTIFVLGDRVFHPDGRETSMGWSRNIPDAIKAFGTKGNAQEWSRATQLLSGSDNAPFAFALLAGAFGAPLMRFTGHSGAMVSLVGDSGLGKTLVGKWALSAYGDPDRLFMGRDDTKNALVSRLGVYGSLPLYIDELSNIPADELSDLVYRITQGRDKVRLGKDSKERTNANTWNTLALTSTNHSLVEKLGNFKADASAEINRVFEYTIARPISNSRADATHAYRVMDANYGWVGGEYAKHLVQTYSEHRAKIDALSAHIDQLTKAQPEERFWSAAAASALYGGVVASRLGLIQFDLKPVTEWVVAQIQAMRQDKNDYVDDAVNTLNHILNAHIHHTLWVAKTQSGTWIAQNEIRGPLMIRFEKDKNDVRLFISKKLLTEELRKGFAGLRKLQFELEGYFPKKALVSRAKKKNLGAYTAYSGGQVDCWEIDMTCPQMGHVHATMLKAAEEQGVLRTMEVVR